MTRTILRSILSGMVLGISLALILSVTSSGAVPCPKPDDPRAIESCSPGYFFANSGLSAIGGRSGGDGAANINYPSLPDAGQLIYTDLVNIESEAYILLKQNKEFRKAISPYQEVPTRFDEIVRQFDTGVGFGKTFEVVEQGRRITIQDKLDTADEQLRQARNLYAFLAVYVTDNQLRRFKDEGRCVNDPNSVVQERCNFAARLRESLREVANLRLIFGQQFMVDAMGLNFSAELRGGEELVRKEVTKLNMAAAQYKLAEAVVVEGMNWALGSGCMISDFYTEQEWALLSRAVEGFERSQHHIAVRKSYLEDTDSGPVAAQNVYQAAAMHQYVAMIGAAGLQARQNQSGYCVRGTRADNTLVAKMMATMLDTRESARALSEGRNIFGFDIQFTPDRPLRTVGTVIGLFDSARKQAEDAIQLYNQTIDANRAFDQDVRQLSDKITAIKLNYDTRLLTLTGCSSNQLPGEQLFQCAQQTVIKLQQCRITEPNQALFDNCVSAATPSGMLRENWQGLRAAYLRVERAKQAIAAIPRRIEIEVGRNIEINHLIYTNGLWQAFSQFILAQLESVSVSTSFGAIFILPKFEVTVSINPNSPIIGGLRSESALRQALTETKINDENSRAVMENLIVDLSVLQADLLVTAQELRAQATSFKTMAAETQNLIIETQRVRNYVESSMVNDPSYKMMRDSARLALAAQLERAARTAYLTAKRVEYEYTISLARNGFRISDIYRARSAQDIKEYIQKLEDIVDNRPVRFDTKEYPISVAQHVLHLTDENLGLTGPAANTERLRRFRQWIGEHTYKDDKGQDVLRFSFSTSLVDNGIFSSFVNQQLATLWLQRLSGVGIPNPNNRGIRLNILTEQRINSDLRYRYATITQAGLLHLRAQSGCIFEYRLVQPAKMLGLEWSGTQSPEITSATIDAGVLDNPDAPRYMQATSAFEGRPLSSTDWQIEIFAHSPDGVLAVMDFQQLTDVVLYISTTQTSRQAGLPDPSECIRTNN